MIDQGDNLNYLGVPAGCPLLSENWNVCGSMVATSWLARKGSKGLLYEMIHLLSREIVETLQLIRQTTCQLVEDFVRGIEVSKQPNAGVTMHESYIFQQRCGFNGTPSNGWPDLKANCQGSPLDRNAAGWRWRPLPLEPLQGIGTTKHRQRSQCARGHHSNECRPPEAEANPKKQNCQIPGLGLERNQITFLCRCHGY